MKTRELQEAAPTTPRGRLAAVLLAAAMLAGCGGVDDGGDDAVGGVGTGAEFEDGQANEPGRGGVEEP